MKTSHHIVTTRYRTTQFMTLEQLTNSKIQMKTTIYIKQNSLKKTSLFQIVLEIGHTYLFLNCCAVIKLL